mmetsp:Transcript_13487/g.26523  ORF Transcript_13487/g.26523 Transcript_13487/m.26523 type:complete len:397 (+) Transcript_13487:57-1247(+)|eukprot:CAMPEP_0172663400 /NCGR_PEP_ID=MMETSP1074-20121228/5901_1 /TAXON_ID=2916 /ORGANISM="Ceratium fusus, Strain PA161109" /LENGTH=396 /DNA_ID=CAMNT_0013479391 /DNA_START=60 /DNA_END=1250 /DNA_ORIENTATION=-
MLSESQTSEIVEGVDTVSSQLGAQKVEESPQWCSGSASTSEGSFSSDEDDEDEQEIGDVRPLVELPRVDVGEPSTSERASVSAKTNSVGVLVAVTVLSGCASQAPYEVLNSRDKGCAPLLSIVENTFGIVASLGALRQPRRLPWSLHLGLAAVNAGYSLLLSAAFSTSLPTTVLVAMKNGNLVASMLLGVLVLQQRYSLRQYAAVLLLSAGLVVTSLSGMRAGSPVVPGSATPAADAGMGVLYLVGALLCRAASGMLQEVSGRGYGASVSELLLYRSALGLPLILVQWPSIVRHALRWSSAEVLMWPSPWLLLASLIVADFGMKVSLARLIDRTSSLTSSLVLTLQRFISFIISATMLSREPLALDLCLGVVAVLGGTLLYVAAQSAPAQMCKKTN